MPSLTLIRYFYPNISGWSWPLGSREVITQHVSPAIFAIMGPMQRYWATNLVILRRRNHSMTIQLPICCFLLCPTGSEPHLKPFSIYMHQNISGSRPWLARVTWRHRSRDQLIPQMSFPIGLVLYCNRVSIYGHFRDNELHTYWSHYHDLSRSRDVIAYITNRFAICHSLLVSRWNRTSISNRLRDIRPQKPVRAHTHHKWFHYCAMLCRARYCNG